MGWHILRSEQEWANYRDKAADKLNVHPNRISWGTAPTEYPCMLTTVFPPAAGGRYEAYTAFAYYADCEELLLACPRRTASPDASPPGQDQFNRWVAAKLMALTSFMVETGLCAPKGGEKANEAAFESKLLDMLDKVDESRAEAKAQWLSDVSASAKRA